MFAEAMVPLGPFAQPPRLALAVSGGSDSIALTLLAHEWAKRNGGRVVALTLNHGLRSTSLAEAHQVKRWLSAIGIEHHILTWHGAKPIRGVQAAARKVRYSLLTEWCRSNSFLNLLLAHHRDDQAETVLFRMMRGSGLDGLAGMASITERSGIRLLRPLLHFPKAQMEAMLLEVGQKWVEDPSNTDPTFARTRVRSSLRALRPRNVSAADLSSAARDIAVKRALLEEQTGNLLARVAIIHPAGFCLLNSQILRAAPEALIFRVLARVLMCIGGSIYPPRFARLERLYLALWRDDFAGRTLGGCYIKPYQAQFLFCREAAAVGNAHPINAAEVEWDGRFSLRVVQTQGWLKSVSMTIGPLGTVGWKRLIVAMPDVRNSSLPPVVRFTLPALWCESELLAVPHLGFWLIPKETVDVCFKPAHSLAPTPFKVV